MRRTISIVIALAFIVSFSHICLEAGIGPCAKIKITHEHDDHHANNDSENPHLHETLVSGPYLVLPAQPPKFATNYSYPKTKYRMISETAPKGPSIHRIFRPPIA